jgi:Protein of unknown function (DUF4232)
MVFVLAIGALLAFCGHPNRHNAERQAARPCQAAQLRASLAAGAGYASDEQATVGLTNEWPEVCVVDGYPLLSVSTVAHRPFPFSANDNHGDGEGPGIWPMPRAIVLHRHMGAYFMVDWVDLEGGPPDAAIDCVGNLYGQVHLLGQRRPVGPPLVFGPLCEARGYKQRLAVSASFHCSLSQLYLPPVTTQPRTASDYCLATW